MLKYLFASLSFLMGALNYLSPSARLLATSKRRWACLMGWIGLALSVSCLSSQAQWMTQSILVKPGWTAIYLHIDASSQSLDQLVGGDLANPISEIWLWKFSSGLAQYIDSPLSPLNGTSQWITWLRSSPGVPSTLLNLSPNAAYLIHSTATNNYTWRIKGKPAPPSYIWDISGLNLIGFATPSTNPPKFMNYLAPAKSINGITELYQYSGGNLDIYNNPGPVVQYNTSVTCGQAFWIRAANVNNTYFGPFKVVLPNTTGIDFGDSASQFSLSLHNATVSNLTVTVKLLSSETPPSNQTPIVGTPPLLVRGALNTSNLTYACNVLNSGGSQSWTLAPNGQSGSDIVVFLGINRYVLTNNPGKLYAGILQFTDSLGFSEVNVPVSAQSASPAGLWVGNANVTQVSSYLKSHQIDANANLVVNSNGSYVVTGINTNQGAVASPFPLRLIIHNRGNQSLLLQRVFYGVRQETNVVVATTESVLDPAHLDTARRITANHLPWSATNASWAMSGQLALGGVLSAQVATDYNDQAVNPFLHTYHPDHDNLDARFENELACGQESYQISRQITLAISAPGNDFTSLTTASGTLSGNYHETITLGGLGAATRTFNVSGVFAITRISPIATLTTR